jgi:diketogulonate reductase-like aldo/keto reductase
LYLWFWGTQGNFAASGLELPAVNQLELNPFNAHRDTVDWCDKYVVAVACGAWSRLSNADGPTEGWDILAKIVQQKVMTKSQVLVWWSLQKGYT